MFQDLILFFVFGHLFLSKFQKLKYLLNKHFEKHDPYHSAAKCKKLPIWVLTITFRMIGGVDWKMEMEEMEKSQKIARVATGWLVQTICRSKMRKSTCNKCTGYGKRKCIGNKNRKKIAKCRKLTVIL